jgi:hypothetical protein
MKKITTIAALGLAAFALTGCFENANKVESEAVERQQSQYIKAQPVPAYDYSLERDLVIQLYNARNQRVATHSVWRSNYGQIEGDCPSMGYGIPYDTSLTNPLAAQWTSKGTAVVGQAEPNGVFASTNTSATWVMCTGAGGVIEPVYVEAKVTAYPYSVSVDYANNRVTKAGESTVTINPTR